MNRTGQESAVCIGKAALKTHALQTLRDCRRLRTARSVWSASDLSALSVCTGRSRGSWSQCMGKKRKRAFHEPRLVWSPAFRRLKRLVPAEAGTPNKWRPTDRFMVPMHSKKRKRALHEPAPSSNRSLAWKSGAEDARTPDASRRSGVSEARETFGVRPIYRRFPSRAGLRAVHGPTARGKTIGGFP
jgi:hypothetical protein